MVNHKLVNVRRTTDRINRKLTLVLLLSCVLSLTACAGSRLRTYPGPEQSSDRVAVLHPQSGINQPSVYFVGIDDIGFSAPQYSALEILPGMHQVQFGYEGIHYQSYGQLVARSWSTQNARVQFEVQAGHQYEARIEKLGSPTVSLGAGQPGRWIGHIVDLATGKDVSFGRNEMQFAPRSP